MKKSNFVFLIGVLVLVVSIVSAITVDSRFRSSTGAAFTEISTLNDVSSPNSLRFFASQITSFPPTNEARFRVNFASDTPLSDLNTISWMQFVDHGYVSHVDVYIDTAGDGGGSDEALVFEYAKVDPNLCDGSSTPGDGIYPTGQLNTFGDKGIVDAGAFAWKNSGPAGPCGDSNFDSGHKSLTDWKTTFPNAKVIAIEIEADGWIAESEIFIDDVMINGELVENFDGSQEVEVEIVQLTLASITPVSLNFGSLSPGTNDNPAVNGPIMFDATGSNTNVRVEVSAVTGFPFETGLKLDGDDTPFGKFWNLDCVENNNVCTFTPATTVPTLSIPAGAISGLKTGMITYTITGPTP